MFEIGIKNQYSTIEPLNFTVTGKGYGSICGFDPTAKILNVSPSAPLLMEEGGHYRLLVEGVMLQKDFVVYELPKFTHPT